MVSRERSISLRTRLGVVAAASLAVVLAAVLLSGLMLRSWDRTIEERGQARVAADDVAELRLAYSDQERGIRGYQLTGEVALLEPYESGLVGADAAAARLRVWTARDPMFDDALDRVLAAADRWSTEVALPAGEDALDLSGGSPDDTAPDDTVPDDTVEELRFATLRDELDRLAGLVDAELEHLDDRAADVRRSVVVVLGTSALVATVGAVAAIVLFRRWIVGPLHEMGQAARALADDDTEPLPHFDSPELQEVSDAVGSLQRSLKQARDEAVAALEGLEQSAVLAIQVRTELADEIGKMPDGWVADSMLIPAEGLVAGDCFDVGLVDRDHLYVVMIDVTGHGATAALDALKAKSQLRAALRSRRDPGASIDWLSQEMLQAGQSDLLTATVLVVELATGRIRYANAGHPPALITDGASVVELPPTGPLVGAFAATWRTEQTELPRGWTLVVHTDGITETIGADRERFGDDRLRACLTDRDPASMLGAIRSATDAFRDGARSDDTTAIAIHHCASDASLCPITGATEPDDTMATDVKDAVVTDAGVTDVDVDGATPDTVQS